MNNLENLSQYLLMDCQTEGSGGEILDRTTTEIAEVLQTLDLLRAQLGERAVEALGLEERWTLNVAAAALQRAAHTIDRMAVQMPPDERSLPPDHALRWRLLGPEFRPPKQRLDTHQEIQEVIIVDDHTLRVAGVAHTLTPEELYIFNHLYVIEEFQGSGYFAERMRQPYETLPQARVRAGHILNGLVSYRLRGVVIALSGGHPRCQIARNVLFIDEREQPVRYDQESERPAPYVPASLRQPEPPPPRLAAPPPLLPETAPPPPEVPAKQEPPKKAVPKKAPAKKEKVVRYHAAHVGEIAEMTGLPLPQVQLFIAHHRVTLRRDFGPTMRQTIQVGEVYRAVDMYPADAVAWIVGRLNVFKDEQARRRQ